MSTNITGIVKSTVSVTPGPDWATNLNTSLDAIDAHDHTSNKGVRIVPAAMNINADLEFNSNNALELKQVQFDNQGSQPTDQSRALYAYGGELYYRDTSGNQVQLTNAGAVNAGGSISGLTSPASANYVAAQDTFAWWHNQSGSEYAIMANSDILLYKYSSDGSGTSDKVRIKYTATGSSAEVTVPNETATLLTTSTSYAGGNLSVTASAGQIDLSSSSTLDLVTSAGNSNITLTPHGSGEVDISKVDIAGGEIDAVTIGTNSVCTDLRVDNIKVDGNTVSATDTNGNVNIAPNGTGETVVGTGAAAGKISSSGDFDLVLETGNSTTGSITMTDGANGDIALTPNGSGVVDVGTKLKVTGNEIQSSGAAVMTLSSANATFAGDVTLNANPTAALGAAPKQYVDSQSIVFAIALG